MSTCVFHSDLLKYDLIKCQFPAMEQWIDPQKPIKSENVQIMEQPKRQYDSSVIHSEGDGGFITNLTIYTLFL